MGTIVKASDYVIDFLIEKGIEKVFGYIGGSITHLYDSLDKKENIEIINAIHEQGAAFAAEGYARITGKSGVALATSGPGATNLITSIGSCFFDSVPTMFITGQVNTYEYKYDKPIRQIGFQETDIVNIIKPIVKYSILVDDVNNLRYEMEKAYFLSQFQRKGPVLIDIPMNIQGSEFDPKEVKSFFDSNEYKEMTSSIVVDLKIDEVKNLIKESARPIILIGGGCRIAGAQNEIETLIEKSGLPIIYSLMGKDLIKDDYLYNLGLIGSYGNRYGNLALANADLILVLGSRLDTRQTGTDLNIFAREAKIIQVDIDKHELGTKIKANPIINADIKSFVKELNVAISTLNISKWQDKLLSYKQKYSSLIGINKNKLIPNILVTKISKKLSETDSICVDVGQHQMWVAQSFYTKKDQRILFSGGMGAMGFALPTSIGVAMATKKRVIVIVGDGSFQMNIQELEIIKRRNLPIKIFILNNYSLGMVRQFQEIYFDKRYIGTRKDYSVPNFKKIGIAYGIKSSSISNFDNFSKKIELLLKNDEPEIIDVQFKNELTAIEPKLVVNKPIEDMYPYLSREELKSQMFIKPLKE